MRCGYFLLIVVLSTVTGVHAQNAQPAQSAPPPRAVPHPSMQQTPPRQSAPPPPQQPAAPAQAPAATPQQPVAPPVTPRPSMQQTPRQNPPPQPAPPAPTMTPHPSMQQTPPRQVMPAQPVAPSRLPSQPENRTVVPHPSMQQVPPHSNIRPGENPPNHPDWGRPVPGFHPHQSPPPHWREGKWRHVEHDGRLGWWWVTGSTWYFFPVPVYPYPNYPYPGDYNEAPPPPPDSGAPAEEGPQYWYFCESAQDYYPYIQDCPEDWELVPVTPEDAP